jgi:hypothetical protein
VISSMSFSDFHEGERLREEYPLTTWMLRNVIGFRHEMRKLLMEVEFEARKKFEEGKDRGKERTCGE